MATEFASIYIRTVKAVVLGFIRGTLSEYASVLAATRRALSMSYGQLYLQLLLSTMLERIFTSPSSYSTILGWSHVPIS